jgi:hypothetical protein
MWSEVQLRTDDSGNILTVSAPDPFRVLLAFCAPKPSWHRCEPREIRAAKSGVPGFRWGVFTDSGDDATLRAIEIRRPGAVGRWQTGDGSGPIRAVAAPESPPGTPTMPAKLDNG